MKIQKAVMFLTVFLMACQTKPKALPEAPPAAVVETFTFNQLPTIGTSGISLGGFSGLSYAGKNAEGLMTFVTHTDRGPNRDMMVLANGSKVRPFVVPDFNPQWVRFTLKPDHTVQVDEMINLSISSKTPCSGRPNLVGEDETPVDGNGSSLDLDPKGLDLEGIASDQDQSFWMSEEYRPSILHFNAKGRLLSRWIPKGNSEKLGRASLPEHFRRRVPNRGFEGVANDGFFVYGFLQGSLKNESGFTRIVQLNKKTGLPLAEYAYRFEETPAGYPPIDKIGDAVAIGKGRFLVIEQNSAVDTKAFRRVFEVDLSAGNDLLKVNKEERILNVDNLCSPSVSNTCVKPVSKRLLVDLVEIGLRHLEKAEGITVIDDSTIAIINDNDFGVGADPNAKSELNLIHLKSPLQR